MPFSNAGGSPGRRLRSPLQRHWRVNTVRKWAAFVGRSDERGELGSLGTALLRAVRRNALDAGCMPCDIDDATVAGLDYGRAYVRANPRIENDGKGKP